MRIAVLKQQFSFWIHIRTAAIVRIAASTGSDQFYAADQRGAGFWGE